MIFIFLIFLLACKCQQLTDGQIFSGISQPGTNLDLYFIVQSADQQHILEITGPQIFSDAIVLDLIDPADIYLLPLTESTSIVSLGESLTEGVHAYGIGCPVDFVPGNYSLRLFTRSSEPQPFSLLYTVENPSLNDGAVISEDVCCRGNGRTVAKNYFFDIPDDSEEINIYVERASTAFTVDGLESMLYARYSDCPEGADIQADYQFPLSDSGVTILTINGLSGVPLVPGSRIYMGQVRSILTTNLEESYVLSVCSGVNCDPSPGQSQSLSGVKKLSSNFIFALFSLFFIAF